MKPEEVLRRTEALEREVLKRRGTDAKTKYMTVSYFKQIKELLKYRIPTAPINISEDGHLFDCPQCGEQFETEGDWTAEDFIFCPSCGQQFKEK